MNKLARELARLLTLAFFIAGVVATPAMAQDKKAEKERVQKVLIDNGKVRVTETTIKRGEVSPNIERPYRITRVLQGGETMRTHADGKTDIVLYSVVPKQAK